jgi:hypothetical protein
MDLENMKQHYGYVPMIKELSIWHVTRQSRQAIAKGYQFNCCTPRICVIHVETGTSPNVLVGYACP